MSGHIDVADLRVSRVQPRGRRATTGAHDRLDPVVVQERQGPVHPPHVDATLLPLVGAPGKLTHSHGVDTGLLHPLRIEGPSLLGPVLRVILHAKKHLSPILPW